MPNLWDLSRASKFSHRYMTFLSIWFHSIVKTNQLIPMARAECDDSLPFSGASSIPLCYLLFPTTLLHQLFFHPLSPNFAIYFLVFLSILLFSNSYIIPFWENKPNENSNIYNSYQIFILPCYFPCCTVPNQVLAHMTKSRQTKWWCTKFSTFRLLWC